MRIKAGICNQFFVISFLDDASILHHIDAVGVADRRKAMRDDQHGAARHQPVEGVLDEAFAFGIEGGGGLVENQDGRIPEHGARDGDALPLATGEQGAAVAHGGVVAQRQLFDESVCTGDARRFADVFGTGVFAAEGDVA